MILQSLRLRPMHGYALVKHIKNVSDNLLQVEEGSLYPLCSGCCGGAAGIGDRVVGEGRPTRIYRLTDAGLRHLEQEVVSFERMLPNHARAGRRQG